MSSTPTTDGPGQPAKADRVPGPESVTIPDGFHVDLSTVEAGDYPDGDEDSQNPGALTVDPGDDA